MRPAPPSGPLPVGLFEARPPPPRDDKPQPHEQRGSSPPGNEGGSLFDGLPILATFWLFIVGVFLLPVTSLLWGLVLVLLAFVAGRRAERRWPRDPAD